MGRILRWLLNLFAFLSHLACVAVLIFWLRSAYTTDHLLVWPHRESRWEFTSEDGRFRITHIRDDDQAGQTWEPTIELLAISEGMRDVQPLTFDGFDITWTGAGVECRFWEFDETTVYRSYSFPYSYLLVPCLIAPVLWLVIYCRRQRALGRAASGHCARCGYDLRPSSSETCPECGTKRYML